jgi:hypothetical protein
VTGAGRSTRSSAWAKAAALAGPSLVTIRPAQTTVLGV